jgi:hypothetical protein
MTIASGALARSSGVLCLALAACGASDYKVASPMMAAPSQAYGGGMAPSHAAIQSQESGRIAETAPVQDRPGLGTTFGEQVYAPISFTPFVRASSAPWAEAVLHYNDVSGVDAHAQYLGAQPSPLEVYAGDGSLAVSLVDEGGHILPGIQASGRALIVGEDGQRYKILVRNGTTARFEIVASVDGLDVIDGKPADPNRRGYIVDPHDTLVIDGFRTSDANVAAFRFGRVSDSYAARTSGDRDVGVVGVAIFSERGAVWSRAELQTRDTADPFPSRGYAAPPR